MLLTHQNAERRYTELRRAVLQSTGERLPGGSQLEFQLFDERAFAASKEWALSSARRVNWDWLRSYPAFKFRHPKRFELALWHKGQLASMTLGRPTHNCAGLRLDFIEASPTHREIKVLPIVIITMTAYAEALGADEIRIVEPINDVVRTYYEGFGMTYVRKGDYLFKRIL